MVIEVKAQHYSVEFYTDDEGRVVAQAIGPLPIPGEGAAARGSVARAVGKSEEDAPAALKQVLARGGP